MNKKDRAAKLRAEFAGALGVLTALLGLALSVFALTAFSVTGTTLPANSTIILEQLSARGALMELGGALMICGVLIYLANKRALERFPDFS